MNILNKIFNKKNNKYIIPLIVLIVIVIILLIYLKEYHYNHYRNKDNYEVYEYFSSDKLEYTATISYDKNNVIKDFISNNYNINYESVPIYFKEEKKVIFPSEMSLIFPLKSRTQYKVNEFSYIEKINNLYYLTIDNYHSNIDHYIMYDGNNLYFFSDEVNMNINGNNIVLSAMSYIEVNNNEIRYYNYEEDIYEIQDITSSVIVYNDYYKINASEDYIEYTDSNLLLTTDFSFLTTIESSL